MGIWLRPPPLRLRLWPQQPRPCSSRNPGEEVPMWPPSVVAVAVMVVVVAAYPIILQARSRRRPRNIEHPDMDLF
jgi:hypothetical protein